MACIYMCIYIYWKGGNILDSVALVRVSVSCLCGGEVCQYFLLLRSFLVSICGRGVSSWAEVKWVNFWFSCACKSFQLTGDLPMAFIVRFDSAAVVRCSRCWGRGDCYKCLNPACQKWFCGMCDCVHCCSRCGGNYCFDCRSCHWCASADCSGPHPQSVLCEDCGNYIDLASVLVVWLQSSFYSLYFYNHGYFWLTALFYSGCSRVCRMSSNDLFRRMS